MARVKTKVDEYKSIFTKLHRIQFHGGNNLISLLTRYLRSNAEYMTTYIDLVSERSGVSETSHITTTNPDIMLPVVTAMVEIEEGVAPAHKDLLKAWEMFIDDFKNKRIKV